MNAKYRCTALILALASLGVSAQVNDSLSIGTSTHTGAWTLEDCIDYAMEHNIQLQQNRITKEQNDVSVKEQRASLFPSLSFSTNQNVSWRPWSQSYTNLSGGTITSTSSEVNYNGSYGLNASWTVWNGGRNQKNLEKSKLTSEISDYNTAQTANSITEQITQLYVQILYEAEAVKVNQEILKGSELQRDRAKEMVEVGSLARADLAQLEAQVSQDEYNVVNTQTQLDNYKLQLKQLLEIVGTEEFDVVIPNLSDDDVLTALPTVSDVYREAVAVRPEIQSSRLSVESSDLDIDIAKRGYYPTVSLSAGIGTSNSSGLDTSFGTQWKNNLSNTLGLTISVPIFDNRQNKSAVEQAKLSKLSSQLSLQDAEQELYSQIESYWLNARNAQQQYRYAKVNQQSMQESYDLVSEQFQLGLKNIVELTTGKNNLLQAEQQVLESKYTALLNQALLRFYQNNTIQL